MLEFLFGKKAAPPAPAPPPAAPTAPRKTLQDKLDFDIFTAAENGDLAQAKALVAKGANVNATCGGDFTPLHFAAQLGDIPMMEFLMEKGANIHAQNVRGTTPLSSAAGCGQKEAALLLLKAGAKPRAGGDRTEADPLLHALLNERTDMALFFIENGVDPAACGPQGIAPLNVCAARGYDGVIKAVLARHPAAIERREPRDGATALMAAVRAHKAGTVALLLDCGAAVDATDDMGRTALDFAVRINNDEAIITELLRRGADVNRPCNDETAVSIIAFAENDKPWAAQFLLRADEFRAAYVEEQRQRAADEAVHYCRNGSEGAVKVGGPLKLRRKEAACP